ncbi:hypothetical protein [Prauserella flavalba]|uniref:Uncharacterized protein n=1 Tax=Prauserella flavalba TaxID=1477506 RepID=A0A318M0D5_9PSEU|nr:hypothetical protein [Prauserella flavalba]PXY38508.1 hypothetical protein BA062_01840 [Prauserella flavalba]
MTAAATGREGRVRRWLSRALLVAGGVAAAWAVSTASASAAEDGPQLDAPAVADAAKGVGAALAGPKPAAEPQDDTPQPARLGDGRIAAEVKHSVQHLWQRAVAEPVGETLEGVGRLLTVPEERQDLGKNVWEALQPRDGELVELPGLTELPGIDGHGDTGTSAEPDRAVDGHSVHTEGDATKGTKHVTGKHRTESKAPVRSAPSDNPADTGEQDRESAPAAPLPIPVSPAAPAPSGNTHALHLDGPLLGIPAGAVAAFDHNVPGSVRAGVVHLPTQPGSQPGVTPD